MVSSEFSNLRSFLDWLRREEDLVEIEVPVDARLEVAEIHRRVIAAGGPALLFRHVKGANFPLVTNLFGTKRRAEMAFGRQPLQLVRRIVEVAEQLLPPTAAKLWAARDVWSPLLRLGTRRSGSGPVSAVVEPPDLSRMPVMTCWPEDGGPFVTLPLVYTEHPDGKGHNLGMYRLQVLSSTSTGMHWQIGKGGGFHYAVAEARDSALPVTVFLGGPPALTLSAIAPLPENVPELVLASFLAGKKLPLVEGLGPHAVPAEAEFVLFGHVPPHIRHPEGPFGDHYGYYSLCHDYPVFRIDKIVRRRDPLYPATVVGKPKQEDFFIGDFLQELLSPVFPLVMPCVEDLWSYGETGYHSLASARVKQRYKRESMAAAFRILGEGQLSLTKFLLVVDRPVDLKDFRAVIEHLLCRTNPETDLYVFSNLSMDTLDYTGPRVNEGSKGVWLGLGEPVRDLPAQFQAKGDLPRDISAVEVFCRGCLVVGGPSYEQDPAAAARLLASGCFRNWQLVILTDEPARTVASPTNFLWTVFTRFEPAADLHSSKPTIFRNHVVHSWPILVDARLKPGFPAELTCSPDISHKVNRRWREYFPKGVEMGDAENAHLSPVR